MKTRIAWSICTILLLFAETLFAQDDPGRIKEQLLKAVVQIKTPLHRRDKPHTATGFLVSKKIFRNGTWGRINFLVTNKHVLGDYNFADSEIRNYHSWIDVTLYRTHETDGKLYKDTRIDLKDESGELKKHKIKVHKDPKVDVAIVELGEELSAVHKVDLVAFDMSYLLDFAMITNWHTGLGDQVFAMGYPFGVTSLKNNYPVAKAGYLASFPGEDLAFDLPAKDRQNNRVITRLQGKILLIDGLIVGGNSGGPVILPSGIKIRLNPETGAFEYTKESIKNFVIGIVSGTLGPSGLSIAFSSDYIDELIDLYLKEADAKLDK